MFLVGGFSFIVLEFFFNLSQKENNTNYKRGNEKHKRHETNRNDKQQQNKTTTKN